MPAAGGADVIDRLQIQLTADVNGANRSLGNLIKRLQLLEATCAAMPATNDLLTKFILLKNSINATTTAATNFNSTLVNVNQSLATMRTSVPTTNLTALTRRMNTVTTSAKGAGKGFTGFGNAMTSAIIRARILINVARRLWRVLNKSITFASDLVETQNIVDKAFANQASKVDELVETSIEQFGMSELSAKTIASRYQAMGVALGISGKAVAQASQNIGQLNESYDSSADSMADMSLNLTKLAGDLASFYNVEVDEAAEALNSVFTGQTRSLRRFGLDLTQATLAEWALKNGLDADVQSMSQAEKTVLRYQYVMAQTKTIHGDFALTADKLCVA